VTTGINRRSYEAWNVLEIAISITRYFVRFSTASMFSLSKQSFLTLKVVELKHLSLKDASRSEVIPLRLLHVMRAEMQLESFTMC
jgi:hypothetical protein